MKSNPEQINSPSNINLDFLSDLALLFSMVSSILESYQHLTTHIVPGPNSISYFVAVFLLPIALLIPPSIIPRWLLCSLFLPWIYTCLFHSWQSMGGLDVMSMNVALWSLVLLVCEDPRKTFRRVHIGDKKPGVGSKGSSIVDYDSSHVWEEPYPSNLAQRLPWVLTLMVSLRLTNWKIGRVSHDKTQPPVRINRADFFKYTVVHILRSYLILDVTSFYTQTDPYFFHSGMNVDAPFPKTPVSASKVLELVTLLPPRLVRVLVLGGQLYSLLTLMFLLPTLLATIFNALQLLPNEWSPHSWPLFFGPSSAVADRGIRGLWGSWWHQMHRYLASTPGYSLAHALGISTSSFVGYTLLTTSAFFFSGMMHMGLIPPEPLNTKVSANEMRLRIAAFFWAQIPAIGIEVLVVKIFQRVAPRLSKSFVAKLLTIIWVATWSAMILPILTVPFRELGYWRVYPIPVSVMQGLFGKGWLPWSDFT